MKRFRLSDKPIDNAALLGKLGDPAAGACVSFEGWVRNHNQDRSVIRLDYQAYPLLAESEGGRIIEEALIRFSIDRALCVHRVGSLGLGELAVWVGVSAAHRAAAFDGCRYIIDEVKARVPIWKNEHYADGNSGWVEPE